MTRDKIMIIKDKINISSVNPNFQDEVNLSSTQIEMLYYSSEPYVLEIIRVAVTLKVNQRRQAYELLKSVVDLSPHD
jgi:hypothetical protein